MKLGISILGLLLFVAGCSGLKGRKVAGDPTANEHTAGVSYYLVEPVFSIVRKTTRGGKPAIRKFELELAWQPDKHRRYEVGMSPGLFTSDSFELQLAPGGSVVGLSSKRSDEVGKAVVGTVNLAAEVAKAAAKTAAQLAPLAAPKGGTPEATPIPTRPWESSCTPVADTPECPFRQPASLKGKDCIVALKRTLAEEVKQLPQSNPCSEPVGLDRTPTPTPDAALSKRIQNEVTCLEALIGEDPPESLGEKLVELKAALKKARAAAITDKKIAPTPEPASKRMNDALKLIDQRSLFERRDALAKLLKSTATAHAKDYAALSQEFDRIAKEIDDLVPSTEDDPDSDATEITSTIDKKVFVDQQCRPLSKEELDVRRKLAKARVLSGAVDAVVITMPVN